MTTTIALDWTLCLWKRNKKQWRPLWILRNPVRDQDTLWQIRNSSTVDLGNDKAKQCLLNNIKSQQGFYFSHGAKAPSGPRPPPYRGFKITLRHTTLGRTALDEWSARCRDLYPTTHNTHKRQTSTPAMGFESTIPASEWPQTHASDRVATGIGHKIFMTKTIVSKVHISKLLFVF